MSVIGVKFRAYPSLEQRQRLSQWMGCTRVVWNAKCDEQEYFYRFKAKFCAITTKTPIDQSYSQFKNEETTPWLYNCPSVLLRNTMCTWKETFGKFLQGECGKPKKKRKGQKESLWFTKEIFRFEKNGLLIGGKKFDLGELKFKAHRPFKSPHSIRIKREGGHYYVSFSYESNAGHQATAVDTLNHLQSSSREALEKAVVGIDRGVKIAAHTGNKKFSPPVIHEKRKTTLHQQIRSLQKRLSRQLKGSTQRERVKARIKSKYRRITHMHREFAHQTSHRLIKSNHKVLVFEDLSTKNMTRRPKAKKDAQGKFLPNKAKAKAGLNRAILDKAWGLLFLFCKYKAEKYLKAAYKIPAQFTSQECADCGHIHPDNRVSQGVFRCTHCGHTDNADANAAKVIKKRAINLILDPGTGLSDGGVLIANGQRALSLRKTRKTKTFLAISDDASKKTKEMALAA
ncbi:MAG TPA: transposase [Myxococcota bacterium]|nr:transposase [Myxococcota bacterium]